MWRLLGYFQRGAVTVLWSSCPDLESLAHLEERSRCEVSMSSSERARWSTAAAAKFWMTLFPVGVPRFAQNSREKLKSAGKDCVELLCRSTAGEFRDLLLFLWFGSSVGHWTNSATAQLSSHNHRHRFIWPQDGGGG